jgi:hypothetical protein
LQVRTPTKHYNVTVGEQIGYRYKVEAYLDKGAFGQVLRCSDMREHGQSVALKISRCVREEIDNARVEARLLRQMQSQNGAK